jgi:hypothetical protein
MRRQAQSRSLSRLSRPVPRLQGRSFHDNWKMKKPDFAERAQKTAPLTKQALISTLEYGLKIGRIDSIVKKNAESSWYNATRHEEMKQCILKMTALTEELGEQMLQMDKHVGFFGRAQMLFEYPQAQMLFEQEEPDQSDGSTVPNWDVPTFK